MPPFLCVCVRLAVLLFCQVASYLNAIYLLTVSFLFKQAPQPFLRHLHHQQLLLLLIWMCQHSLTLGLLMSQAGAPYSAPSKLSGKELWRKQTLVTTVLPESAETAHATSTWIYFPHLCSRNHFPPFASVSFSYCLVVALFCSCLFRTISSFIFSLSLKQSLIWLAALCWIAFAIWRVKSVNSNLKELLPFYRILFGR